MAMQHLPSIASFSGIAGLVAMVVAIALIGFFLRRLGSAATGSVRGNSSLLMSGRIVHLNPRCGVPRMSRLR
jgi:hypothetical protein